MKPQVQDRECDNVLPDQGNNTLLGAAKAMAES
jgi:hypothetical protein